MTANLNNRHGGLSAWERAQAHQAAVNAAVDRERLEQAQRRLEAAAQAGEHECARLAAHELRHARERHARGRGLIAAYWTDTRRILAGAARQRVCHERRPSCGRPRARTHRTPRATRGPPADDEGESEPPRVGGLSFAQFHELTPRWLGSWRRRLFEALPEDVQGDCWATLKREIAGRRT